MTLFNRRRTHTPTYLSQVSVVSMTSIWATLCGVVTAVSTDASKTAFLEALKGFSDRLRS